MRVRLVTDSMKASHYGNGGSDRCGAPRSGDAPRCSFGRPSRTWIVRPSTILPSKAAMAGPASTSVISTKANPRDRPLSLSVINLKFANRPKRLEKRADCLWCRTEFKLPTKIFFIRSLVLRTSYARPICSGRVPPSIISCIRPTSALPRATSSGLPL